MGNLTHMADELTTLNNSDRSHMYKYEGRQVPRFVFR
jgi:hypothetical protein